MGFLCAFSSKNWLSKQKKVNKDERYTIENSTPTSNMQYNVLLFLIPFKPELFHSALDGVVSLPATGTVNTPQRVIPDQSCSINISQKRYLIVLNHCGYIFLLDSSAQDLNSFSLLTKHGQGKRGVLENKNKRATRKIRITAGRPQCINRPRFLTFFKMNSRPPSGGFFAACGILLCYVIYYIYSYRL